MLLNDPKDSNRILDYNISFDDESKKKVLEILNDSFSKRIIGESIEEIFLLHKEFTLINLHNMLEIPTNIYQGGLQDLMVYDYKLGNCIPKKSIIGNIDLGEEIKVTRTAISCSFSSIISFILHHLDEKECNLFISKFDSLEKIYLKRLLDFGGYERLTILLGTVEAIKAFFKKCQSLELSVQLEDIKSLERVRYFQMLYGLTTLTPRECYDRRYLNSISGIDEMERETIQNILDGSTENTEIIKTLRLEPKHIILEQKYKS